MDSIILKRKLGRIFNTKKMMKFGYLLIFTGIVLIAGVITTRMYYNAKANKHIQELEAHIIAQQRKYELLAEGRIEEANDMTQDEDVSLSEAKADDGTDYTQMYTLEIDRFGIKGLIAPGTSKNVLKYAIGHYDDTALPGQTGNCCLAGHSSIIYNEIFNGMEENIKKDDIITIKSLNGNYRYKVTDYYVVDPNDLSVLSYTNKPTLTITTCTDHGKKRFIVKAELIYDI